MAADWSRRGDRDGERRGAREEAMRRGGADEESYGGRGYEHVGQEQQGGWRGPGEMPGYQEAGGRRPRPFLQTSGGQVPGEIREWDRQGPRPESRLESHPEPRDGDPRDRGRDPRSGPGGLEGRSMQRTGPHAGRGPRSYRRPDHRIHEEVCERLTADPFVDARDIEVEVVESRVLLRGAVPERSMKHRAEDIADGIFGVADVDNQIRVQRPGGSRAPGGEAARARVEDEGREGNERGEDSH